jgi:hypothetical protein
MATHYIARGEPTTISATTTTTVTYTNAGGSASYDVSVAAGGNPVLVNIYKTGGTIGGNIVVLPGTSKTIAPPNPPLSPANVTILTTTTASTSTVYLSPVVTMEG